jgi:molecular chaperone DnaK (HSP70)
LEDADIKKDEIDEIVLVGGSTRIPKIQQLVKDYFNGKVSFIFERAVVAIALSVLRFTASGVFKLFL